MQTKHTLMFANKESRRTRRRLLVLEAVLLAGFLGLGVRLGPFANPDARTAVFVGMLGVAAMAAIQNALIKLALPGSPSTGVITTNTTQLVVDVAVVGRGRGDPRSHRRVCLILPSIARFVIGCAAAA